MSHANQNYDYEVAVIGAGHAGLAAALEAAAGRTNEAAADDFARQRVALIECHKVGGSVLWGTEIPAKTLIRSAQVFDWVKRCEEFGVHVEKPRIVWSAIKLRIADVRDELRQAQKSQLAAAPVTLLAGEARLVGGHGIEIRGREGVQAITAARIVLATGREETLLPVEGLAPAQLTGPLDLLARATLPRSMVFLGGSAWHLALAQAFVRLGSQVTVLCTASELLPDHDPEISRTLARLLTNEGVKLHLGAQIMRGGVGSQGAEGRSWVEFIQDGVPHRVEAGNIVGDIATIPRLEGLNLAAAGIEISPDGIGVDGRGLTSQPHISAVGSVATGADMPALSATQTDPQAAKCGLTVAEAQVHQPDAHSWQAPLTGLAAPVIAGESSGLVRFVTTPDGRLLGVHILSGTATELLAPFAAALHAGLTLHQCLGQIRHDSRLAGIGRVLQRNSPGLD